MSVAVPTASDRHRSLRLIAGSVGALGAILLGSMLLGGPLYDMAEARMEAETSGYRDVAALRDACPMLKAASARALADGRLDRLEARRLAEAMYAASDAYDETSARADAMRAAGVAPVRVTPECRTWGSGPAYGLGDQLFRSYRP